MSSINSLNKLQIIGNVGKMPTFHTYGEGKQSCRFSVATTESWKNKNTGEWEDQTEWHNVVVFNKYAVSQVENFITVGSLVYVEGASKTRKYRPEGATEDRYIQELVLGNFDGQIKILAKSKKDQRDAVPAEKVDDPFDDADPFNDDIPY